MIIAIAADHAGRPLLDRLSEAVRSSGHEPLPVGPADPGPADDYPDIARAVGEAVLEGRAERGIAVCGSGAGVSVAASKMHGIHLTNLRTAQARAAKAHRKWAYNIRFSYDDVDKHYSIIDWDWFLELRAQEKASE